MTISIPEGADVWYLRWNAYEKKGYLITPREAQHYLAREKPLKPVDMHDLDNGPEDECVLVALRFHDLESKVEHTT